MATKWRLFEAVPPTWSTLTALGYLPSIKYTYVVYIDYLLIFMAIQALKRCFLVDAVQRIKRYAFAGVIGTANRGYNPRRHLIIPLSGDSPWVKH